MSFGGKGSAIEEALKTMSEEDYLKPIEFENILDPIVEKLGGDKATANMQLARLFAIAETKEEPQRDEYIRTELQKEGVGIGQIDEAIKFIRAQKPLEAAYIQGGEQKIKLDQIKLSGPLGKIIKSNEYSRADDEGKLDLLRKGITTAGYTTNEIRKLYQIEDVQKMHKALSESQLEKFDISTIREKLQTQKQDIYGNVSAQFDEATAFATLISKIDRLTDTLEGKLTP